MSNKAFATLAWLQLVTSLLLASAIVWGYSNYQASLGLFLHSVAASVGAVSNVVGRTAETVDARRDLLDQTSQMLVVTRNLVNELRIAAANQAKLGPQYADGLHSASVVAGKLGNSIESLGDGLLRLSLPAGIQMVGMKPIVVMSHPMAKKGQELKDNADQIKATQQVDAGLKRALVSFASARAVSGVISVLQGTQIDIMPAGLGATFAPGQVLAPINELVKHFSDLMLVASVSFGIQKVLITMSSYWLIKLVLTITAVGWASFFFLKRQPPAFISKILVVLLMLRFAVPSVALGSDFLAEKFMASDYATSQKAIDTAMGKAAKVVHPALPPNPPPVVVPGPAPVPQPWWHLQLPNMPNVGLNLPKIPDFTGRFEEMKAAAEQATEHMVRLMGIFLLQTLVIPLLLLWGLYGIAKAVFQLPKQLPNWTNSSSKAWW